MIFKKTDKSCIFILNISRTMHYVHFWFYLLCLNILFAKLIHTHYRALVPIVKFFYFSPSDDISSNKVNKYFFRYLLAFLSLLHIYLMRVLPFSYKWIYFKYQFLLPMLPLFSVLSRLLLYFLFLGSLAK
jgi:hypothetical protein